MTTMLVSTRRSRGCSSLLRSLSLLLLLTSLVLLPPVTAAFVIAVFVSNGASVTAVWRGRPQWSPTTTTSVYSSLLVDDASEFEWSHEPKNNDTTLLSLQVQKATTHMSLSCAPTLQKVSKRERLFGDAKAIVVKTLSFLAKMRRNRQRWRGQQDEVALSPTVLRYQSEGSPQKQPQQIETKQPTSQKSSLTAPPPPEQSNDDEEDDAESIMFGEDNTNEKNDDNDGATLGDIMGTSLLVTDSLADVKKKTIKYGSAHRAKTTTTTTLAEQYGIQHPLDRMALTANGNLQRLVSSYYDAPVSVCVVECIARPSSSQSSSSSSSSSSCNNGNNNGNKNPPIIQSSQAPMMAGPQGADTSATSTSTTTSRLSRVGPVSKTWDRLVHLSVHDQVFCTAQSVITVTDPLCVQLIDSGQVGIGQLFRYLDLLPEFVLLRAGPGVSVSPAAVSSSPARSVEEEADIVAHGGTGGGGFWREYTLQSTFISCHIFEEFCPNLWQLQKEQPK